MANENDEKTVTLNGKTMSSDEFENEKKSLLEKKVQLVETSKDVYVTRLLD
jgi:hypothetical protein